MTKSLIARKKSKTRWTLEQIFWKNYVKENKHICPHFVAHNKFVYPKENKDGQQ